jgi:colanic acid biosynthesis glycosyl transferase WcaI
MGVKQGLEILVAAAALVRNPQVRIVLCGDGAQRETLAERVKSARLSNVLMLPLQPEEQFVEMLVDTDLAVITQKKGSGAAFFPSKLLRNLALAVPVLTVAENSSGLARALAEAGCGVNVGPEQPEVLARAIEMLAENPAQLRKLSQAGRKYVEQFEMSRVLAVFEAELKNLVGEEIKSRNCESSKQKLIRSKEDMKKAES